MSKTSDNVYILGVPNFANYEAAASLIRIPRHGDGPIDYVCIGEDRLTRLKHTFMFPLRGIDYCLKHFGLESLDQVDYIATDYARIHRWHNSGPAYRKLEHDYLKLMLRFPRERIFVIDHHQAHAASCYYPSGFQEAGVLIVDGMGSELITQSAYHFRGNTKTWEEKAYDWGIGRLYSFVTASVLPYGPEKGYGKVMGLAPYGRNEQEKVLNFGVREEGMNTDYSGFNSRHPISRLVAKNIPKCTDRQEVMKHPFPKAAFEIQEECERQLIRFANYIHDKTGTTNLCISGGVGLNGRANYRILKESSIKKVWIQPGCSDTGISFGLALAAYYQILDLHKDKKCGITMPHAYCGSSYSDEEICKTLDRFKIESRPYSVREIAELIADQKIVALFEGGSEFGPRALGHRSILADPRDPDMKDRLNRSVKFREGYRPYAPVVLLEDVSDYFDLGCESPFMLLVADVKKNKYNIIPSVTHVDGTARVQTVTLRDNGLYYDIIREFKKLTGVPVLLNTSFNINREPIVETPLDALICALGTSIDYLILQGLLIDCQKYRKPEFVRQLEAIRKETLDTQYAELTRKHLHHYDKDEMTRYLDEENKIAEWYRDYRAKYEMEKAMMIWENQKSRVLIVGTRLHTKCLYLYIPEFPSVNVVSFVPIDGEMGEKGNFDGVYPEHTLAGVDWNQVDVVLVSSHEYQRKIQEFLHAHPKANKKQIVVLYDSACDSLVHVLPERWPVMNPLEADRHHLVMETLQKRTASNIDFDFEPVPINIGERYGISITYHYCHPPTSNGHYSVKSGVDPKHFVQQVAALSENFTFATCRQLVDPNAQLPESVINLTFDDGLKDFAIYVAPVLRQYNIPASVFVCSRPYTEQRLLTVQKVHLLMNYLGLDLFRKKFYGLLHEKGRHPQKEPADYAKGSHLYRYDEEEVRTFKMDLNYLISYKLTWPILDRLFEETFGNDAEKEAVKKIYLSEDDLKRLIDQGIEIGLHGHDHKVLPRLDYEDQRKNIKECVDFLGHLTGQRDFTIAYPQGFSDVHTKRVLKELGIWAGFGLGRKMITPKDLQSRWDIPRYDVNECFDKKTNLIQHDIFSSLSTGD